VVSIIDLGALRIKELEDKVRKLWKEKNIPAKWRSWSEGRPVFAFLEGPPTANGYPHVGHIRGRTYKDFVLKYYRLTGHNVWAQGGWDEQGLPVEVEVEKKLKIKKKKEIADRVGYEKFVEECNKLVDHYLRFWEEHATERLALWLDLENAYETRKAHYLEHVWYFLKSAWDKGLLYEGFRVLPFCPRCETALSDAEVDQGYEEKVSPSIFVKFRIMGTDNQYLLIWTTTPWTLIDNEAVAANPEGEYCKVKVGQEYWILAKDLIGSVMEAAGVKEWKCVESMKGADLEGIRYEHVFLEEVPIHKQHDNAHKVITAEFVSLQEGTGLVHIAPGHGPEDYEAGLQHNLPITSTVEINGVFNTESGVFNRLYVEQAAEKATEILKQKGLLVYEGKITHKYPHCWRCGTPLIYRADKQWFLKVSAVKEDLIEALNKVNIYPEKLKDRFYNWVANVRDWTISRSRIWGTPLPIWRCKDDPSKFIVVGSIEELKKLADELPTDDVEKLTHRPWIDKVKLSVDGCSEWVREPYVVDVWIDSGMAWLASVDGLRNKELFNKLYPYRFVTEGIDQTRGWFYSLLATSVILNKIAPYREVLMQGHVLDKYGRKMSKHLGNVVWAHDLFGKYGVDPVRLYILTKFAPGDPFAFDVDEIKEVLSKLNIIWNVFRFAATYMKIDKFTPSKYPLSEMVKGAKPEDMWILSRINTVLKSIHNYVSTYEIHKASRELLNFFIEDLSHGYLRLVRPRVWREEDDDKYVVYSVLYYVLKRGLKALSPIIPHFTEELWQKFIRNLEEDAEESVHLSVLESVDEEFINPELEESFKLVFEIGSLVASLRNELGLKLRWPIREVIVELKDGELIRRVNQLVEVVKFLGNSKEAVISDKLPDRCFSDEYRVGEEEFGKVCIPSKLDRELYLEALAREIIRRVQVMRNKLDLNVEEFIELGIVTDDEDLIETLQKFGDYILREVRSKELHLTLSDDMSSSEWVIEGKKIAIGIRRLNK